MSSVLSFVAMKTEYWLWLATALAGMGVFALTILALRRGRPPPRVDATVHPAPLVGVGTIPQPTVRGERKDEINRPRRAAGWLWAGATILAVGAFILSPGWTGKLSGLAWFLVALIVDTIRHRNTR